VRTQCLSCDGEAFDLLFELTDKANAHIIRCNTCDLVQLEELPDSVQLDSLYADGYFEGDAGTAGYAEYKKQEEEYLSTFAEEIRRIQTFRKTGTLLDVGCGFGYFLRKASEAGFDAYGIDLSAEAVREAERHSPGRVFHGTIDNIDALSSRKFEVIFASHLIEHILEPHAFVANLVERLSENGILVFVTPNVQSWLARVSGKRWVSFKIPEHVAYYQPKTIRRLLESAGLEVIATDAAYQYYRLPFLMSKIRDLVDPIGRIIPGIEHTAAMRDRMIRVTSGSMRVIARRPSKVRGVSPRA
jgi:2-polyprenyl-3-methyl-5-hydroxy-6-metoxy-1,4-benzoquinol methylase